MEATYEFPKHMSYVLTFAGNTFPPIWQASTHLQTPSINITFSSNSFLTL